MVEINLLPPQYRKRSGPNVWTYASVGAGALTLLLMAVPELMVGNVIGNMQRHLDDENGQISALNRDVRPVFNDLTRTQADLAAVSQTAQSLSSGKTYWSTDLANFVRQLPANSDVALKSLTMTAPLPDDKTALYGAKAASKQFDLSGEVSSTAALARFLNTYDGGDYGVNFKNAKRDALSGTYTFAATVGQLSGQNQLAGAGSAPANAPAAGAPSPAAPSSAPAAGAPSPAAPSSAPAAPAAPVGEKQ